MCMAPYARGTPWKMVDFLSRPQLQKTSALVSGHGRVPGAGESEGQAPGAGRATLGVQRPWSSCGPRAVAGSGRP